MKRVRCSRRLAIVACTALLAVSGGCVNPTDLLNIGKPPIRVGVTKLELSPPPLILPPHAFQTGLMNCLKEERVAFELMLPRQIGVNLASGRFSFALLSAADYAQIPSSEDYRILAVPINQHGQTRRRGLIVLAPQSKIQSLSEIKGKRFHFMPHGDILNDAALGAVLDAGLSVDDLDRGILGLGLDTHHISSLEVAKSVVLEGEVAGVIDEADYDKWPDKGGSLVLLLPSKEQVRVIAKTVSVPEGPFLVSAHTDPTLSAKVQQYLLKGVVKDLIVRIALGYRGFAEPIDPNEYAPFCTLYRKLHPPPPEEEEDVGSTADAGQTRPAAPR